MIPDLCYAAPAYAATSHDGAGQLMHLNKESLTPESLRRKRIVTHLYLAQCCAYHLWAFATVEHSYAHASNIASTQVYL